jgi:RecB family endonuclease NucS
MGKVRQIRAAIQACFAANATPLTKAQVLAWIGGNYRDADFNSNTLTTQLYRSCANVNHTQSTSAPQILWYEKRNKTYRLRSSSDQVVETAEPQQKLISSNDPEFRPDPTFALEAHLRDYLARNLKLLESGLTLWSQNPPSVEFGVAGRRIDILAKDTDGVPVIIELKLSRGHEQTVGQSLYYRGRLRTQLNVSRVRIIMVAAEITDELRIASNEVSDVALYEYSLSMSVNKVS